MSTSTATVLVGITTHNRAHILPRAIRSALSQKFANVRVAVIDDGSTDGTPSLRAQFPEVTWERNDQPKGYMECRNKLMREAGTDYYVSLDDDAWFMRNDELSIAVRLMQDDPKIAAIAFDILSPDRPTEVPRTPPQDAAMFIGCGHLLRLSAVHEAGYYASAPGAYGSEEKDLSLRLADLGCRVVRTPGVHVWHEKAWQDRDFFPIHRSGVCNELVMTLRRCPFPDVCVVFPLKLASFARFWLRRPSFLRAGLAGVAAALGNARSAWATRAPVRRETFWRMSAGRLK